MNCKNCGHTVNMYYDIILKREVLVHKNIGHDYPAGMNVPICRIRKCNCLSAMVTIVKI